MVRVGALVPVLLLAACGTSGEPGVDPVEQLVHRYPYCAGRIVQDTNTFALCRLDWGGERHVFVGADARDLAEAEVAALGDNPVSWWVDGYEQIGGVDVVFTRMDQPTP